MAQAPDTIGNWTTTEFQRVVRELILQNPPDHLGGLSVDDLTVIGSLTAQGTITYSLRSTLSTVGASGQPGFLNSWVNGGAPYRAAGYTKTEDGWIRLHGSVKNGSVGSAAFALSPGFRPTATSRHAVASNAVFGIVDITSAGLVIPQSPSSNVIVSLDGIQFKAA